ncbi:MAG: hypothetical protein QJT81_15670 [Candidatus Thiothrix putei]|uniref:Uncharacterized protein n=1 Tax=Candidatus Thiothrix putei TaxID=3080811 RepID=A0AA95KHC3_9GAMM|nr:MAG: hypothetical protein QJT81_15670 [Candidatus Thiothrix putei]
MKVSTLAKYKYMLLLGSMLSIISSQTAVGAATSDNYQKGGTMMISPLGLDNNGTCFSTFSGGTGADAFSACVTADGNIARFDLPSGNYIYTEGYAVCSASGNAADAGKQSETGWNDPTILQPNGPNKLPLTITRTTADGVFSLVQKYAFAAASKSITVTMTLKNTSGVTQPNVRLSRIVDADVESFDNIMSNSRAEVVAFKDPLGAGRLSLTANTLKYPIVTSSGDYSSFPWLDCSPAANTTTPYSGDTVGKVTYEFGSLAKNISRTVAFVYTGE